MSGIGPILLDGLYLYVAIGIVTAVTFITFGVTRVFEHPVSMTIPARILLLPGATVLWPIILFRWLGSRNAS